MLALFFLTFLANKTFPSFRSQAADCANRWKNMRDAYIRRYKSNGGDVEKSNLSFLDKYIPLPQKYAYPSTQL